MAGVSLGPTPWWQLPQGGGRSGQQTLDNLVKSAPSGYEYDPVKMAYVRTPTSAGERVNQFQSAAMGNSLSGLMGAAGINTGTAAQTSGGGVMAGGSGIAPGSQVPGVGPIDTSAEDSAIFGRAKDTAGKSARSSIESLRGLLGETGQLGGGAEAQATREIGETALGQVLDVNRTQAINNSQRAFDTARTNQAAAITQRGQDIAAQEAAARLAQEQAQLEFQKTAMQSQNSLNLLKLALSQVPNGGSFLY